MTFSTGRERYSERLSGLASITQSMDSGGRIEPRTLFQSCAASVQFAASQDATRPDPVEGRGEERRRPTGGSELGRRGKCL